MDDSFTPISDYGIIGNDDRCVLVGRDGSIDWCCFPHLESPSVFAAILDPDEGGRFAVHPAGEFDSAHEYVARTNVLETTFETETGVATLTDFMPVRTRAAPNERFQQALYRKLEGSSGTLELDVVFEPRFDYARAETSIAELESPEGAEGSRNGVVATGTDERLTLSGDVDFELDADRTAATATVSIEAGETCWFCLQYGVPSPPDPGELESILEETVDYWREWTDNCEQSATAIFDVDTGGEGEWRDVLVRSALVLKLLIHEETGSICAAPTTSLPEEMGGELNWDYRYNWIRDAKFTVQALYNVGQRREARRYFEWFREIGHEDPEDIQPLYGLHSEPDIEEELLEHLSGYRNSKPVRIGNEAATQEQLDIYGTIVQGIYETIRYEGGFTDEDWESICSLADYVCGIWDGRDASIWEFRRTREHFVHSKLLCWVALDRALELADEYDREAPRDRWDREREAIRAAILERGYDESLGSFVQHFDTEEAVDATALLIPLYDFLPADDHRVQGTIETVLDELTTDDGLVYRFANTGFREEEPGAFFLCSFWLVDALVLSGRIEEAKEIFSSVLEYTTELGLLSEMVDPGDGTLLGNHPQAFSHIGLLNSALYLASASDDVEELTPDDLRTGASSPLFRRHDS